MRRSRSIPALLLAFWPFAVAACAVDDGEVRTETTEAEATTSTTAADDPATTTTTTDGDELPIDYEGVVEVLEDEGYEVAQLEAEAPSARPEESKEHGLVEVEGNGLEWAVTIEMWFFVDDEAAEDGAEEIRDEVESGDGGSFVTVNGSVAALFACTCEAESEMSSAFADLDLTGDREDVDEPATTTTVTVPRDLPGPDGDDRLAGVLEQLEDAGATVVAVDEETEWQLGADAAATVTVEVDGEEESLEVHVFSDSDLAFEVAQQVEDEAAESCGACDALLPQATAIGEVVFVALEGSPVEDVLSDLELP